MNAPLNIRARIMFGVTLKPEPRYTIMIPFADDPTKSVRVSVAIKAPVTTKQEASEAARKEMMDISDAELGALVVAELNAATSRN